MCAHALGLVRERFAPMPRPERPCRARNSDLISLSRPHVTLMPAPALTRTAPFTFVARQPKGQQSVVMAMSLRVILRTELDQVPGDESAQCTNEHRADELILDFFPDSANGNSK